MTAQSSSPPPRLVDVLAAPWTVAAAWVLHGVLFTALLLWLMPTIAHVDANSADILQKAFAPAYQIKNPPIYEWLELLVQGVIGPGPASFLVVRYTLMGLIGLSVYGAVRDISGSRPAAAAASYGLMSFYWFAWYFHDSISHSILVALACVWFLWAVAAHLARPSWRTIAVLALVSGLGIASKYNFLILVGGSLAVIATDGRLRPALKDWRLLVVPIVAALMAGPIMLAADRVGPGLVGTLQSHVTGDAPLGLLDRVESSIRLAVLYVLFLLPWGLFAAYGLRPSSGGWPTILRPDGIGALFLQRLAIVLPVLAVLLVFVAGVRSESLSERYLFPLLFSVPLAVHVIAGRRADAKRQVRLFAGVALAVLVATFAVRLADATTATRAGSENKRFQPFDRLAPLLEARGLGEAFYITPDRWESGQINAALPAAHAAGLKTQRRWTPMSYPPAASCVLFWLDRSRAPGDPEPQTTTPTELAGFVPAGAAPEIVTVPWAEGLWGGPRTTRFHLIDLGRDAEACRTVFGPAL